MWNLKKILIPSPKKIGFTSRFLVMIWFWAYRSTYLLTKIFNFVDYFFDVFLWQDRLFWQMIIDNFLFQVKFYLNYCHWFKSPQRHSLVQRSFEFIHLSVHIHYNIPAHLYIYIYIFIVKWVWRATICSVK